MNRLVFMLILIVVPLTWIQTVASVRAEETADNSYRLEDMVVTATRQETSRQDVAANITVIDRAAIERIPAATVGEVLQYIPGVSMEFAGGPGALATTRIQGSETRHVAVYVDGVPQNTLANPLTDLSSLTVENIERIEVYKGAASSAWGSSLGGVINIITRTPDPGKAIGAVARSSYGKADTTKNSVQISGSPDRFGYFLSATGNQSDGFEDHSAYDQTAFYGKFNYDLTDASRVNFVWSDDDLHNDAAYVSYPDFWDDIDQDQSYQRLLFETRFSDRLGLSVEGRHHYYDTHIEDVYADHREIYNDYDETTWGGSARLNWTPSEAHDLNLGFDGDSGRFDWINYAETYSTRNWATYANDTFTRDQFTVNAGLRYDDNQDFGSAVSPAAGVVYRLLNDQALVRAQVARGFSAPPAAWVKDPVYGTEDLDPETATNYQVGTEFRFCRILRLEINTFYADVEDLIRYVPDTRKYENIDEVTRKGLESTLSAAFDFGLSLAVSASFTDVEDETTHKEVKDIPTDQYQVSALYNWRWMTHSLLGKYMDYNSTFPETKDRKFVFDYLFKARLPQIRYLDQAEVFCAVYNLFDATTIYRYDWPQPDRWAEAGIRLAL
ncbi:MAG: TonB-dependent receptor [Thermodesulfobacteriota bacterium]